MKRLGSFFADKISKILPDSFVFALLLTVATFLLAFFTTETEPKMILGLWFGGLTYGPIIQFAFYMMLIIVFGYALGISRPVAKFFDSLAGRVNTPFKAYLSISFVALIMSFLNWGLAPIAAVFAIEVCRRVKNVDFRLACAAVYLGTVVWHGGFSASAPLMMASEKTAEAFISQGLIAGTIPITQTLFSTLNITTVILMFLIVPPAILLFAPKTVDPKYDGAVQYAKKQSGLLAGEINHEEHKASRSLSDRLNNSWILTLLIVISATILFVGYFDKKGWAGVEISTIPFIVLFLGMLLHWRPINYINAVKEAIKGAGDIALQFPFYGGIMVIFIKTGMAVAFANWLSGFATEFTLPWFAFLIASIVNLFIPSGGGEWLVLGAPILEAASMVGVDHAKVIMSFAYGDALTNLLNPFWTLAFLPVMCKLIDLRPRDFMGYTVLMCIVFFVILSLLILFIPA